MQRNHGPAAASCASMPLWESSEYRKVRVQAMAGVVKKRMTGRIQGRNHGHDWSSPSHGFAASETNVQVQCEFGQGNTGNHTQRTRARDSSLLIGRFESDLNGSQRGDSGDRLLRFRSQLIKPCALSMLRLGLAASWGGICGRRRP